MTALLLENLKVKVSGLELVPAGGGCFEVSINGTQIYSKLETGEFPDEQAILEAAESKLA